jgi:mediator of RNA polymerase II transcription subunit 13
MNHPIKRFKAGDLDRHRTGKGSTNDLYAGQACSESSTLPNLAHHRQNYGEGGKNGDESKRERTESEADKNSTSENLFTSEGLQPSYADLNKIFDNSDDNSNDDHVSF